MRVFRFVLVFVITIGLFWALGRPWPVGAARIPPPGKFLNPFAGFWSNGSDDTPLSETITLAELTQPVTVRWDDRRIPHIFAANDHDAYFMQGYLTARDRLWQMEFQTLAAAGRLSEIVGDPVLDLDRYHRRLGIATAARNALQATEADHTTLAALQAYTAGINAWIDSLNHSTLPLEYKILDYEPEPWTTLKTPLLLKSMSLTLTGRNAEKAMTITREIFGQEETERLFPSHRPFTDPIIPAGTRWNFTSSTGGDQPPLANGGVPVGPDLSTWSFFETAPPSGDQESGEQEAGEENQESDAQVRGSNNWAVAGSKTATGFPILSSDPHLPLSLPSVWYELQMTTPEYSAYGVSMPGSPGILIGFNQHIAWGETNAETDVLDQFLIRFRDDSFKEYFHDGSWKPVTWQEERYEIRDGEPFVEKIAWTHHGPVAYLPGEDSVPSHLVPGAALRWTAHDGSNETKAFLDMNKATDYPSFVKALSSFDTPAQNFVFASRDGDIAIRHEGNLPLRTPGQGVYLSDGTDRSSEWHGSIPREELPHILNPEQGFVGSANQHPVDETYPHFLGADFAPWDRSTRIYQQLDAMQAITPERMIDLQNDATGLYARMLLPALLKAVQGRDNTEHQATALTAVSEWNHSYDATSIGPTIFDYWQREMLIKTWTDELEKGDLTARRPKRDTTLQLILEDPESIYFDDRTTEDVVETFRNVANSSFAAAVEKLVELHGAPGEKWQWGGARGTNLRHVAQIPGMSRLALPTDGQYGVIRVATSSAGQSWRMVVSLGDEVKAWGTYPGGQSGNPGSMHYDDFVSDWMEGELAPLLFLKSADQEDPRLMERVEYRGAQ
jgi:penicillin amidase